MLAMFKFFTAAIEQFKGRGPVVDALLRLKWNKVDLLCAHLTSENKRGVIVDKWVLSKK